MNFLLALTDGQSCVDVVNVQQQGDYQLDANSQVIIPMSNTSCNGRITGFMMSLSKQQNRINYPRIEVWKPTKSPTQFKIEGNYTLAEQDIISMTNYHYAYVSLTDNKAIKFEKGSFIGIYLPPKPCYTVWSIKNTGYSYYTNRKMIPRMKLNIRALKNTYVMLSDHQPLIQVVFGT